LVDTIVTAVFSLLYVMVKVGITGAAAESSSGELLFSTADYFVSLTFGLVFVLIGGYVAGRMARVRPAIHGLCVGIVVLALSILIEVVSPDPASPAWFNVASFGGVVLVAWLGGYLAGRG
jgi:hypothetical protein